MSNALEQLVDALKEAKKSIPSTYFVNGNRTEWLIDKAIAAGEQELKREPVAEVCDCEGTTDDDGRPLHYALLYLLHPLPPETKLYTREEVLGS